MNKIKFEHGGGDGLEFGTFNAEKTSIFTDEYRFNKDGVWKMATRHTETSDKIDAEDATTNYKYIKPTDSNISELVDEPSNYELPDDFYDLINVEDEQCTTRDIIRTAQAFNGAKGVHSKITSKGNLEIETSELLEIVSSETATTVSSIGPYNVVWVAQSAGLKLDIETFMSVFADEVRSEVSTAIDAMNVDDVIEVQYNIYTQHSNTSASVKYKKIAPSINIESAAGLKLKGELDFGSTFNFGETDNGIEFQYKKTKKSALKDCTTLKVVGINNSATSFAANGQYIAPGTSSVVAEASAIDVINVTNDFSSVDADDVKDVVNLFTQNGIVVDNENIKCSEPIYIVKESRGAYYMINDGKLPSGSNNWGGTYESQQFPNVYNDVFRKGFSMTESELKSALGVSTLPSFISSVTTDGGTFWFIVKNKEDNLTWGIIMAKYGEDKGCSVTDIISLVNWMKENNEGPWSTPSQS